MKRPGLQGHYQGRWKELLTLARRKQHAFRALKEMDELTRQGGSTWGRVDAWPGVEKEWVPLREQEWLFGAAAESWGVGDVAELEKALLRLNTLHIEVDAQPSKDLN